MNPSERPGVGNADDTNRRCQNCNSFITPEFGRVFGDNDDEVYGCLECMSGTEVRNGKARSEISKTPHDDRGSVH
ncbi:DUF7563 family protein [Haladaptatus sp. NG-WS-4]